MYDVERRDHIESAGEFDGRIVNLVAYAVGHTRLSARDLRSSSPYNTYVHVGLPPTPIAAPGEAAIRAALQPADGDWIYYVLASKDGAHAFTNSYQEFLRLKAQAKAKGLL